MPNTETREQIKPRSTPYVPSSRGRPTAYTQELADEICDRLIGGELITQICQDAHMPCRQTVWLWREREPDFSDQYARAERLQTESLADDMLIRSRDESRDYLKVKRTLKDGTIVEEVKSDNTAVLRDSLVARSYQWIMERRNPDKYMLKNQAVNVNVAVAPAFNVLPVASATPIEHQPSEPVTVTQVIDNKEGK